MADEPLVRVTCPLCGAGDSRPERVVAGYALERCGCGLVFVNPQPPPAAVADIYTDRDADYLTEFYARSATPAVLDGYHAALERLERLLPGRGRLLDFGCAAGYFTETAARRGWDAVGVDLGKWTKDAAARRGFHGIRVGPLEGMGFAPGTFDIVNASQVFEHLSAPRQMLAELAALLRPGGLLAVDVPNYHTLSILLGRDDFASNTPPQHLNYFTPRTLRALLRSGGLRTVRVGTGGGLKWENLLGRPVRSDILDAHAATRAGNAAPPAPTAAAAPAKPGWKSRLKGLVMAGVVKPVFYDALKTGMLLYAVARKGGGERGA